MAQEVFVSPGVYTQELDETFTPAGAGAIGAALIGLTQKGPAFRPVRVNNFGEFRETFGGLSEDKYMPYAAKSYLRNGTSLQVVRTLGRGTKSQGNVGLLSFPNTTGVKSVSAVSGGNTILGVVRRRTTGDGDILVSGSPTNFALSADGTIVTGLSLTESSGNYIKKVLGTDPEESKSGEQLTGLYVDAVFNYQVGSVLGSVSGTIPGGTNFASATADGDSYEEVTGGFSGSQTPFIVSQNHSGSVYELFRFWTTAHGDYENSNIKVGVTQVAYNDSSSSFPTFTVIVRKFNDTDREPVVLETFINCNLNPSSKQYIGRVIGDRRPVYDLTQDPPEILFDGDYANRSNFVRVEIGSGFPSSARPSGFKGVPKLAAIPQSDQSVSGSCFPPAMPTKTNHLNLNSAVDGGVFTGIDFDNVGINDRLKKTVTSASGTTSADDGVLLFVNSADYSGSGNVTSFTKVDILGSNSGNFSTTNKVRFTVPFYDGWDGFDIRRNLLDAMVSDTTSISGDLNIAVKTLANADEVDFNLLAIPGVHSSAGGNIAARAIEMVERRADAFYLLDIADATTTGAGLAMSVANAITEGEKYDSNYAATYFPWTRINDVDNDKLVWVPPSVEMMGVYSFNDRVGQPWFAPAGFNRGSMNNVLEVRRRLTQSQRDDLYSSNINPIATFPGQGIVVFGQKTLQKKQSVLDRVNVRRMLIEVRKAIASLSRLFLFEANSVSVRENLLTQVNNYLANVQSAQGLTEFRAVLDETTTTPDLIDRNTMKGKIYLKPTTVAEVIIFDFNVTPQGATFSE